MCEAEERPYRARLCFEVVRSACLTFGDERVHPAKRVVPAAPQVVADGLAAQKAEHPHVAEAFRQETALLAQLLIAPHVARDEVHEAEVVVGVRREVAAGGERDLDAAFEVGDAVRISELEPRRPDAVQGVCAHVVEVESLRNRERLSPTRIAAS